MNTTTKPNRILYVTMAVLLAVLLIGAGGFLWLSSGGRDNPLGIGGPFTLLDGNGQTVTDKDFRGKYMLVYFGYTFCPDVCPTTLNAVADAMDKLGPADLVSSRCSSPSIQSGTPRRWSSNTPRRSAPRSRD